MCVCMCVCVCACVYESVCVRMYACVLKNGKDHISTVHWDPHQDTIGLPGTSSFSIFGR